MTQSIIKKAVIADAGIASRYLPVTKVYPKGLLPLLNKTIMDWVVLECQEAGIEEIIIVTDASNINTYERYYHDSALQIKEKLHKQNKTERYNKVSELFSYPKIKIVPQLSDLPYGSASPLVSAQKYLENEESFVFCQGDDVILGSIKDVRTMVDTFNNNPNVYGVIMAQDTPTEELHHYGVVKLKNKKYLEKIVERPQRGEAPSNLVSYGRYLLKNDIFNVTEELRMNHLKGEFMLVDAITKLASTSDVMVCKTKGTWFTTGDPLNHLKSQIAFAANDKKYKDEINAFIKLKLEFD
jgi:UTP--glucose-1-phosphate uridylyltransferase